MVVPPPASPLTPHHDTFHSIRSFAHFLLHVAVHLITISLIFTTFAGSVDVLFIHSYCILPPWRHPYQEHEKYMYRVSQEECARLRESVPYVKLYRYNPKHLYPKLNGYGDNGLLGCPRTVRRPWSHTRPLRMPGNETPLANIVMQWPWRDNGTAAACVKYLET